MNSMNHCKIVWEAEEMEAKEQLAMVNGGIDERNRLQLETVRKTVTRHTGMERLP